MRSFQDTFEAPEEAIIHQCFFNFQDCTLLCLIVGGRSKKIQQGMIIKIP